MVDSNSFIHAYNFVRYDPKKSPVRSEFDTTNVRYTGYMDCSIYVKTPLAIPDSEKCTEQNGHKTYPFFSVGGKPVIPGSEIRGLVRNIYEIITDSCFSVINSNVISSRNITSKKAKLAAEQAKKAMPSESDTSNGEERQPGILRYDSDLKKWILYKAIRRTAYTETTKKALLELLANTELIERDWALSVQLSTNMQKLKYAVDQAIKNADGYDDMLEKLKIDNGIITVDLDQGCEGFIFERKARDRFGNPVSELNKKLNSVNAEKKWGAQYAKNTLEEFFKSADRKERYKLFYTEEIINFSAFIFDGEESIESDALEKAVEKLNTILDFSEMYAEGDRVALQRIAKVRPNQYTNTTVPVFYHGEGNQIVLTPSHFSREIYDNTVETILGERKKCTDKNSLCPGCRLFGMIGNNDNFVASRIRFTDAIAKDEFKLDERPVALKILASPKTTGWEFYADRDFDEEGVILKGRKMYFHNPLAESDPSVYKLGEKKKSNASFSLMKEGTFPFRAYFDRATEDEIKNSVLALTLGENNADGTLMHKMGHGKPLGLGSIKITVDNIVTRNISDAGYEMNCNRFTNYLTSLQSGNPLKHADNLAFSDLLRICDYNYYKGYRVSYPVVEAKTGLRLKDNDTASHRYFDWLREAKNQTKYTGLPAIEDDAEMIALPILVTDGKNRSEKSEANNPSASHDDTKEFNGQHLVENRKYKAKITGEYTNKKGESCFNLEIDGLRDINGKKFSVFKSKAPLKKVGDTIDVTYKGLNDFGYAKFWL